jgi:hypothetical protein
MLGINIRRKVDIRVKIRSIVQVDNINTVRNLFVDSPPRIKGHYFRKRTSRSFIRKKLNMVPAFAERGRKIPNNSLSPTVGKHWQLCVAD